MTIIPLNQSLRGDERKKIDKTTQKFKCKAKKSPTKSDKWQFGKNIYNMS